MVFENSDPDSASPELTPVPRGGEIPEEPIEAESIRTGVGKGRVAYVPSVTPGSVKPPASKMSSRYWKLPVNWKELIAAVRWAAAERLSVEVMAPTTVAMELMVQKPTGNLLLHLLNYDEKQTPVVTDIEVNLQIPEGKAVQQIQMLTPDGNEQSLLEHTFEGGRAKFVAPRLRVYNLLIIQLKEIS